MSKERILVWLPSPIGDSVLCSPALRAIREKFSDSEITFLASGGVRQLHEPSGFCDGWVVPQKNCPFCIAKKLKGYGFTHAIMLKNSFGSAMAVWLAKIPIRIGYSRQGRGMFLNSKLYAPKLTGRKFEAAAMIDYYMAVAGWLGCDVDNRLMQLDVSDEQLAELGDKLDFVNDLDGPLVILVPGGAFGPSKCWKAERFAKVADWLKEKYNATVVISVAANDAERKIADDIVFCAKSSPINLRNTPINLAVLKALISRANVVLTNDTGPRHIAIALGRKVVTMFGPNDPAWTQCGYDGEIQIVGKAECAPCSKKICFADSHICMDSIIVDDVCEKLEKFLC